jgi:ubiquitin carboxyl-terminal hydrolase L5
MSSEWCTIESDPAVFTELLEKFGVKDTEVREIYSLDETEQQSGSIPHGLIFLFKWRREADDRAIVSPDEVPGLFFASQVVTNACATQAILSVLLNSSAEIGDQLEEFKTFVSSFDSETKGLSIGNSESIRQAHNSFARPEPFISEEKRAAKDGDDVYHFIAYVPHKGAVYELDGLKQGPILLGAVEGGADGQPGDWMKVAKPAVEARMARYSSNETHFALLSVAETKTKALLEQLRAIEAAGGDAQEVRLALSDEEYRMSRDRDENMRRRTNYIPAVFKIMQAMVKAQKLIVP